MVVTHTPESIIDPTTGQPIAVPVGDEERLRRASRGRGRRDPRYDQTDAIAIGVADQPVPTAQDIQAEVEENTETEEETGIIDTVEGLMVTDYHQVQTPFFQVWIGYTQPDDISFVYGEGIGAGDGGFLTVGAENAFGNSGGTVYFDGVGDAPAPSYPNGEYEVDVFTTPGEPGGSHTISYKARGKYVGSYVNYAFLKSDAIPGISVARFAGEVVPR